MASIKHQEATLELLNLETPFLDDESKPEPGSTGYSPYSAFESSDQDTEDLPAPWPEQNEWDEDLTDNEEFLDSEHEDDDDLSPYPEQFLETDQEFQYDSEDDDDHLENDEDRYDEDDDQQDEQYHLDESNAEQQLEEGDEYWAQEQSDYDDDEPEQYENALLDDDIDDEADDETFDDSVYFDETSADMEDFDDIFTEDETLSGDALQSAVAYNQKYAASLGWLPYFDSIVQTILKLNFSPDAHAFAEAVAAWQDRTGLGFDGKIGPTTWQHMKALLGIGNATKPARPSSGKNPSSLISTQMPPSPSGKYVVNVARRAYGLPETINALKWIGNQWHKQHPEVVFKIRDISKKGGGKLQTGANKYHKSHQIGLDCDLQLLVNGVRINTLKSSYTVKQRGILRDFIKIILANPILNIKVIGCTESVLAKEFEKVRAKGWNGHNRHLHVRFCVPEKYRSRLKRIAVPPISYYDCKPSQSEVDESSEFFDSESFFDEEVPLPEAELLSAIQYNRIKMVSLGWQKYYDDIVMHILKLDYSPNEEAFAQAVAQWQANNGLDDDGKVGPGTWSKFKKLLGIGSGKPKAQTTPKTSYKKMDWNTSEQRSLVNSFSKKYSDNTFSNASEINSFFKRETGQEFCEWFRQNVGLRGFYGKIPYNPKYTKSKGRSAKNIQKGQESNFRKVFDNIPLLYSGDASSSKRINLLEFFALTSIIINEHSGKFTVTTEKGSLPYLFRYNPKDRSSPRSAYNLLRNKMFMDAHRHKGKVPSKPIDTAWKSRGKANYPSSAPTSVSKGGVISELDFCKFRGRGLTQVTFRGTYRRLISHIMSSSYRSSSPYVNNFKKKFAGKSSNTIAVLSSNKEWDDLFMKTDYEIAYVATYVFQKNRNDFLDIDFDTDQIIKERTKSSGAGSLFYVGYRQGGTRNYGRVVKKRVMQMMEALVDG